MNTHTSTIETRRQAFALAAALTLTVLTGAGALFGLAHKPVSPVAAPAPPVLQAPASPPATAVSSEGGDN